MTISELSISTGGKYIIFFPLSLFFPLFVFIFSPCVFIFSLLGHAINCSTFTGGVLGENILSLCFSPWPCCMVFILPFFLDSFLDMSLRRNNIIFSPLVQFLSYLTVKLVKTLMGERKMVFFSHFHIFPLWTMLYLVPLSDSYGTEVHENDDIYPWLKCTSSACKFSDFVMNNPDNCSFNHFFFSSIPIALLSLAIVGFIQVNTLLTTLLCFLEKPI